LNLAAYNRGPTPKREEGEEEEGDGVDHSRTLQSEWPRHRLTTGPDGTYYYPELEERYLSLLRTDMSWNSSDRADWMSWQVAGHLLDMRRSLFEMRDWEAGRIEEQRRRNELEVELARVARERRAELEAELARDRRNLRVDLDRVWFNHLRGEYQVLGDRALAEGESEAYHNAYSKWPAMLFTPEGRRRQDVAEGLVDERLDPFNPEADDGVEGPEAERVGEEKGTSPEVGGSGSGSGSGSGTKE
jgi:hypothetical protein